MPNPVTVRNPMNTILLPANGTVAAATKANSVPPMKLFFRPSLADTRPLSMKLVIDPIIMEVAVRAVEMKIKIKDKKHVIHTDP